MSPIKLGFLTAFALSAQNGVFYISPTIYPGSRLFIFAASAELGGGLQAPPPPPFVTLTTQGREYKLPWISQRFPPADELDPNPNAGPVYLVPPDLPLGPATLRYGDFVANTEVGGRAPNEIYSGYAQQQTAIGPLRRNRLTDPARPDDQITLWGTGMDRVSVSVAGNPIENVSIARQSDGLDRIEFRLPALASYGCETQVIVNGKSTTIATADHGHAVCAHRFGFDLAALTRLDRGGKVPLALFSFGSVPSVAYGDFSRIDLPRDGGIAPPPYGCVAKVITALPTITGNVIPARRIPPSPATITTPQGATVRGSAIGNLYFFAFALPGERAPWLAGDWTFELRPSPPTTVKARAPIRWTSTTPASDYSRDRDFVIEWIPELPFRPDEFVQFQYSQIANQPGNGILGHSVSCAQPLSAGRLVIPSSLMRSILWVPNPVFPPFPSIFAQLRRETSRQADGRYVMVEYRQSYEVANPPTPGPITVSGQ